MSETVRIKNPKGGWLTVQLHSFGKFQTAEGTIQGILVLTGDDAYLHFVTADDVHPDDFKCLANRFMKSKN